LEQLLSLRYLLFGSQISFQEMAIAFLSAGGEDGVSAIFKGFEKVERVKFPSAHQLHDAHIGGILKTH